MIKKKIFEFGEWLSHPKYGSCQFIHYDNADRTKCTIDVEGEWKHIEASALIRHAVKFKQIADQ